MQVLALFTLLGWLATAWEIGRGNRRLRFLKNVGETPPARSPRVSIVIAARNEAHTIGAALPTLLRQDYPDLELIAVNDRSEDETGAVLERLAAGESRLRVEHVRELPRGWIGKNHALHLGAARATGEWILFTDADVHFSPDTVRRAVAHAEEHALDHVCAAPRLTAGGNLLGICVGAFSLLFGMFLRPWRVPDPRSRAHAGIGAFNLVRATTYRRHGGHAEIALRPDDDVKLGKLLKLRGGRSEFLFGANAIAVQWYASVPEFVRGLRKNMFAGVDYRVSVIVGATVAHAVFFLWPVAGLFFLSGMAWWLNAAALGVMLGVAVDNTRFDGGRWWHGLALPLGIVIFDYVLWDSMLATLRQRGIVWRGTHYPLAELRANRV